MSNDPQILSKITEIILEHATCGILLLDKQAHILYANREITTITGYPAQELVGRNAFEFTHPREKELRLELFQMTLSHPGQPRDRGYMRFRHKSRLWTLIHVRVLNLLADPNVCVIIAYFDDASSEMSRYIADNGID